MYSFFMIISSFVEVVTGGDPSWAMKGPPGEREKRNEKKYEKQMVSSVKVQSKVQACTVLLEKADYGTFPGPSKR